MHKVLLDELNYCFDKNFYGLIITGYKASYDDILIPEFFDIDGINVPVMGIDMNTFNDFNRLKKVEIASQYIKKIESWLFAQQVVLESVSLPESVIEIEEHAFAECLSLKDINLDFVKNIKKGAFSNCKSLSKIELNNCNLGVASFVGANICDILLNNCKIYNEAFNSSFVNIMRLDGSVDFIESYNKNNIINNLIVNEDARFLFLDENFDGSCITVNNFSNFKYVSTNDAIRIINKQSYEELIANNYSEGQINQILLGYNDDILLNILPPQTDINVFRLIREKYKQSPIETLNILNTTPDFSAEYLDECVEKLNKIEESRGIQTIAAMYR